MQTHAHDADPRYRKTAILLLIPLKRRRGRKKQKGPTAGLVSDAKRMAPLAGTATLSKAPRLSHHRQGKAISFQCAKETSAVTKLKRCDTTNRGTWTKDDLYFQCNAITHIIAKTAVRELRVADRKELRRRQIKHLQP